MQLSITKSINSSYVLCNQMVKFTLIKTFGDYPQVRILDFLIGSRDFDYPITEIAKEAKVNFQTLKKLWPDLEKNKLVISTRTLGGASLYKINVGNPVVEKMFGVVG